MSNKEIINWLLAGDVSVQYQTYRDLLDKENPQLRKKIEKEGWGEKYLSFRKTNGYWSQDFYQPKWISTHYTLLDLKNLNLSPNNKLIKETLNVIFNTEKGPDGGIKPFSKNQKSDVCVNGMVLNYACYFQVKEEHLKSVVDFLLSEKVQDGGFNCQSTKRKVTHSSLHTTLSVLEGIFEYINHGYAYRLNELIEAKRMSEEFILAHHLFRSHRTGEIINPNFLKFYYPTRWFYDILKAMDYFQLANVSYDNRMDEAIELIQKKRNKEGQWRPSSKHTGKTHFRMEPAREPSRWNTLRALRVLKFYKIR